MRALRTPVVVGLHPRSGASTIAAALHARFGAVVVVPHLGCWARVPAPSEETALLLGLEAEHLPQPLRAYANAMRDIAAAVVDSGQLTSGSPPMAVRRLPCPDLDDEALEAAGFGATRRATG